MKILYFFQFFGSFLPSAFKLLIRIRIQQLKLMRIHADPDTDPQPWRQEQAADRTRHQIEPGIRQNQEADRTRQQPQPDHIGTAGGTNQAADRTRLQTNPGSRTNKSTEKRWQREPERWQKEQGSRWQNQAVPVHSITRTDIIKQCAEQDRKQNCRQNQVADRTRQKKN
jgi:hypothetical protein